MIKLVFVTAASCLFAITARGDALDTWTPVSKSTNGAYTQIIYANGAFLAISQAPYRFPNGGGGVSSSSDGEHWNLLHAGDEPSGVAFGNGFYVRTGWDPQSDGDAGFTVSATNAASPDLTNACEFCNNGSNVFTGLYGLAFGTNNLGQGMFVAVGHYYENYSDTIITSSNGANWTQQNSKVTNEFLGGVAFGNNLFVAVGYTNYLGAGTNGSVLRSSNGTNWTYVATSSTHITGQPDSINFVHGQFYVTTDWPVTNIYFGSSVVYTPTNTPYPSIWVPMGSPTGTYVSVNSGSNLYTSTNGFNWTLRNTGITNSLKCIAYGGNHFVIGCADGALLLSGSVAPTLAVKPDTNGAYQIGVSGGLVSQCTIQASSDLKNWTNLTTLTNLQAVNQFSDITATNHTLRFYRGLAQ